MGQQICMYIMMIFQKEEVMVTCFLEKKAMMTLFFWTVAMFFSRKTMCESKRE